MLGEFVFALLGLAFGSFSNVLVFRLSKERSIRGRSHCPYCHHLLVAVDLVPVLSYVFLNGKCRYCKKSISPQYPLVEVGSAALFLWAYVQFPMDPNTALIFALALWLLFTIGVFDLITSFIPDALSLPFILIALLFQGMQGNLPLLAILVGFTFFGFQWLVSRGTWVGSGDMFFGAGIGALVGSVFLTGAVIFFAYVIGALIASALLLAGKVHRKSHIPFGPFLVLGTLTVLIFQERLVALQLLWF